MNDSTLADIVVVLCAVIGLVVGSFANVVIARVPAGESVVRPRSRCPQCGHELSWFENIPVLSWVALRAKCRSCCALISAQYPGVEFAMSGIFAAVAWWYGPKIALLPLLWFAAASLILAIIDWRTYRLPNAITYPLAAIALVVLPVVAWVDGGAGREVSRILLAALSYLLFLGIMHLVKPGAMGMGDVKLSPSLGAFCGLVSWGALVSGVFAAFLIGSVVGVITLAVRKRTTDTGRGTAIPFGPSLIAGAWVGVVFGDAIAGWYLGFLM